MPAVCHRDAPFPNDRGDPPVTEAEIDGALSQLGSFARSLMGGGSSASHPAADEELFGSTPLHGGSFLVPRSAAAAAQPGSPAAPAAGASQVVAPKPSELLPSRS